jgi:hypothetical protein
MIKFLSLIIIGLILSDCANADNNRRDILLGKNITTELYNRLKNLELISADDKIIGLNYSITNEPTHKSEMYTFFTSDKILQYYQSKDNEPRIITIPISSILNIERKTDPLREDRIAIEIKHFRTITFNERKQQDDIFDLNDQFWLSSDSKENKQEKFYQLLHDTWTNNIAHEEMRNIYSRFYDEYGNRRITTDQEFARNKLSQLRQQIEKLTINIVNHDDFFVAYHEREVYLFRYDYVDDKFTVFHVITKDIIEDNMAATTIILSIYPIHRHGELALPYTNRGYTITSAFKHYEKEIEQILENHMN